MKTYEYSIFDPGGNVTALVTSTVSRSAQARIGNRLLTDATMRQFGIEQVGFIEQLPGTSAPALRMAGGELCLNAARCAAEYILQRLNVRDVYFTLESNASLSAKAARRDGSIELIVGRSIVTSVGQSTTASLNGTTINVQLVELQGITQILTPLDKLPPQLQPIFSLSNQGFSSRELPQLAKIASHLQRLSPAPAIGLTAYKQLGPGNFGIRPLVWVENVDSTFYETACGSASLALTATFNNSRTYQITQPSESTLSVQVRNKECSITGPVTLIASGFIDL